MDPQEQGPFDEDLLEEQGTEGDHAGGFEWAEENVGGEVFLESSEDEGFKLSPAMKAIAAHDLEEKQKVKQVIAVLDWEMTAAVNREWENLVSSCRVPSSAHSLSFPWEVGFMGRVFSNKSDLPSFNLPTLAFPSSSVLANPSQQIAADEKAALEKRVSSVPGAWRVVAARLGRLKFHETEETKRQVAMTKWRRLLLYGPEHCRLGRRLLSELLSFSGDGYLNGILQDVFAKKATATMSKRADHMLEFFTYCQRLKQPALPLSEPLFYQFLREVRAIKAPTAPKSSKESVSFSEILGFDGADSILESERISGLCHRLEITKRPTKRAVVLKRTQVVALERTLLNPGSWLPDRIMAGHCLFCVFGRLRWRDSQWVANATIDGGFLECQTLVTKTSTTALKKTTFLPIVVPLKLLETENWADKWLELRERAGLPNIGEKREDGSPYPALPTVDRSGHFTDQPLSATGAGKWLREIIKHGLDGVQVDTDGQSSHALKSTTLSWVSKHGSMQTYERKLLGYHIDQAEGSMHCYSRDIISAPMRRYQKIIEDVASGVFDPDDSRSGHFKQLKDAPTEVIRLLERISSGPEPVTAEGFVIVPEDLEPPAKRTREDSDLVERVLVDGGVSEENSSSSDSEGSSSANSAEDVLLSELAKFGSPENLRAKKPSASLSDVRYIHSRLKTLHSGHAASVLKLACGRRLHAGYRIIVDVDDFPYPKCTNCFGAN